MSSQQVESSARPTDGRSPLTVIIVTYESASVLGGLLDTIPQGLAGIGHKVIVVDNDSRDDSVAIARAHPACHRVIETGYNGGYAAGINAATRVIPANADVLILNPDVRLTPGMGIHLLNGLTDSSVGAVVPRIADETGALMQSVRREPSVLTTWSDALLGSRLAGKLGLGEIVYSPALYRKGGPIDWATGAVLMIAGRARELVGEWDESFFLYSEEVDYLERMRRAGLGVRYVTEAVATHIGGAYHSNPRLSAIMTANRIRYYGRHHGAIATLAYRCAILFGEAVRWPLGPGHRAAAAAALTLPDVKLLAGRST